ncbi:MAG: EVE domain-containing protein [Pirellula staleyi]
MSKKSSNSSFWLMKTEPEVFSIRDLANAPNQSIDWFGIRNYQARNYMRDQMNLGDRVLVYHSNAKPSCVVGTACVVRTAYPDHTAWDANHEYFDPKSDRHNPRWFMVDIQFESEFSVSLSLAMLREVPKLSSMVLLRKGSRLSIQPVTEQEFKTIVKLGR